MKIQQAIGNLVLLRRFHEHGITFTHPIRALRLTSNANRIHIDSRKLLKPRTADAAAK